VESSRPGNPTCAKNSIQTGNEAESDEGLIESIIEMPFDTTNYSTKAGRQPVANF
jgi:hypothetical protein